MKENSDIIELNLWGKVVGCIISSLVIISNSVEIHFLRRTANKPFYEKMLLSLTVSDLIGGVFSFFSVLILCVDEFESYIIIYWNVWGFVMCYSNLTSLLHLIIIGGDRLWSVKAPFHHRKYVTMKKLLAAVSVSWIAPMIFVIAHIIIVLINKKGAAEIHTYYRSIMFRDIAIIVIIADFILLLCYCAIVWIISKNNRALKQNRTSNHTLILCIGIVISFVIFTTPFVVVYLTSWNRPLWLEKLCIFLFPLNQISNSIMYFIQKHRSNRHLKTSNEHEQRSTSL